MKIVPKLRQESRVPPSGPVKSEDCGPPLKRPRVEDWETVPDGSTATSSHASTSKSSRTPSAIPDSTEWLRARITQLEAELSAARAARDMSISEQDVLRAAHEAEQRARREAMLQKSAAEAALSQAEVEQGRLRAALEVALSVDSAQPNGMEALYGLGATADGGHSEALDRVQESHQQMNLDPTALGDPQATTQRLKSEVEQLKSDLAATQERLGSTQRSLESMKQIHSSALEQHESTKGELETYKLRLEDEQTLMKNLKDKLIPEVYKSLGATHETLGAFLSAMGEPPASEPGDSILKEELD
ncbi:hypothetical protein RSAG8_11223, partial [Rhizoctonia solani AG-8 WAC10335]